MSAACALDVKQATERLRWGRYSSVYQKRLLEGGASLESFLRTAGLDWSFVKVEKAKIIDGVLEEYVKRMHSERKRSSLRVAKHAILIVQILRPRLRKKLQAASNSVRSWEEMQPSSFRPPLPIPILAAMICKARLTAEENQGSLRVLWHSFATLLMVGFFGLLRPGELFNLRASDVNLANSLSL